MDAAPVFILEFICEETSFQILLSSSHPDCSFLQPTSRGRQTPETGASDTPAPASALRRAHSLPWQSTPWAPVRGWDGRAASQRWGGLIPEAPESAQVRKGTAVA